MNGFYSYGTTRIRGYKTESGQTDKLIYDFNTDDIQKNYTLWCQATSFDEFILTNGQNVKVHAEITSSTGSQGTVSYDIEEVENFAASSASFNKWVNVKDKVGNSTNQQIAATINSTVFLYDLKVNDPNTESILKDMGNYSSYMYQTSQSSVNVQIIGFSNDEITTIEFYDLDTNTILNTYSHNDEAIEDTFSVTLSTSKVYRLGCKLTNSDGNSNDHLNGTEIKIEKI